MALGVAMGTRHFASPRILAANVLLLAGCNLSVGDPHPGEFGDMGIAAPNPGSFGIGTPSNGTPNPGTGNNPSLTNPIGSTPVGTGEGTSGGIPGGAGLGTTG